MGACPPVVALVSAPRPSLGLCPWTPDPSFVPHSKFLAIYAPVPVVIVYIFICFIAVGKIKYFKIRVFYEKIKTQNVFIFMTNGVQQATTNNAAVAMLR